MNKVDINPTTSVITQNANGLNAQIKRQRLSECIKKHDPTICLHITCCLQETHFKYKDTYGLKVNEWKMNGEKYAIVTLIKSKWVYYINFRQSRLQSKESYQVYRKALQNDEGVTSPR